MRDTPLILAATAKDDDVCMAAMAATARRTAEQMSEGEPRKRAFEPIDQFERVAIPGLRDKLSDLPILAAPGRIEILELILARKLDFKTGDQQGMTVMHHAARFAASNVVELLVAHGGDVNLLSRDWRMLAVNEQLKQGHLSIQAGQTGVDRKTGQR